MYPGDILEFLRAKPFQPFQIQMVGGDQFEIRHPEMAMVTPTYVAVGIPSPQGGGLTERVVHLALSHVERVEKIPQPSTK